MRNDFNAAWRLQDEDDDELTELEDEDFDEDDLDEDDPEEEGEDEEEDDEQEDEIGVRS